MVPPRAFDRRFLLRLIALGLALCIGLAPAPPGPAAQTPIAPLAPNDVSILFPVPKTPADLSGLIALKELANRGTLAPGRLWSETDFARFVTIATSPAASVTANGQTHQIKFPPGTETIDAWFVTGIRVDVSAPGLSPEIMAAFGQIPQIRLIVQPVTVQGGKVTVHDMAAHLIFGFVMPQRTDRADCLPTFPTDIASFRAALADFAALRDDLAAGKFGPAVATVGPLGVHPGLSGATSKPFRDALQAVLEEHLVSPHLSAMAVMGIPAPRHEPWIFLSMAKGQDGVFGPVPNPVLDGTQFAQMLQAVGVDRLIVRPLPTTDNQNPITCRNAITTRPFPAAERKGVATAALFETTPTPDQVRAVTGTIADPAQSHFFNTDCVSCHTETRRTLKFNAGPITGIASDALPADDWNLRNFGWFPSSSDRSVKPSVTRRTAAETDDVVKAANALLASQ